jgi:N-acetylglucosaminyl-diphospho-decaprenol L-rhamnosyltransferase
MRQFPNVFDAVGHATLGRVWPTNPFTRRYRETDPAPDGTTDWVSGSCLIVRRSLFEELGGFDERYFMFAEDMDLCWRAKRAGHRVGTAPDAMVTPAEVAPLLCALTVPAPQGTWSRMTSSEVAFETATPVAT